MLHFVCVLHYHSHPHSGQIINNGPVIAQNRPTDHSGRQPRSECRMVLHINGLRPSKGELCARVYVCAWYLALFISLYYVSPHCIDGEKMVWRCNGMFVGSFLSGDHVNDTDRQARKDNSTDDNIPSDVSSSDVPVDMPDKTFSALDWWAMGCLRR